MFRRLTAATIVLTSLLGVALPALAWSAGRPMHDCCSGDPAAPCSGSADTGLPANPSAKCCAATAPAVLIAVSRASPERVLDATSAGNLVSVPWPVLPSATARSWPVVAPPHPSWHADASLTYLHTARLRL